MTNAAAKTEARAKFASVVVAASGVDISPKRVAVFTDDAWDMCFNLAETHDEYVANMTKAAATLARQIAGMAA